MDEVQLPDDASMDDGGRPYSKLYEQSVANTQERDAEWLAKAALVVAGIHGLGRLMGKNLIADTAHQFGRFSRFVSSYSKEIRAIPQHTVDATGAVVGSTAIGARLKGNIKLESYPLVQDIAESISLISDAKRDVPYRRELSDKIKANFNALMATEPEPSFLHKGLDYLRVSDILDNPDTYLENAGKAVSSFEVSTLRKAVEEGLIHSQQVLDRNLFKDASGKLLDTRTLRPRDFLDAASKIVDPFGLTRSLKSFTVSNRTVAAISSGTSNNDTIFIGGNVYEASEEGMKLKASGKTIGFINDARHLASALREIPAVQNTTSSGVTFWDKLQEATGVGPKYHEKRGGFIQTTKAFFRSLKGVSQDEYQLYARDFKNKHESFYSTILDSVEPAGATSKGVEVAVGRFYGQGALDPKDLTPTTGIFKNARGWFRRMKAYAGLNEDVVVINKKALERVESGGDPLSKKDLALDFGRAGIDSLERPIGKSDIPTSVSTIGKLDYLVRPQHYAASGDPIDRLYDFANWMTIRLNKLSSVSLAGIGFKPSGNLFANLLRTAAIPTAYYMGKEAIKYADYSIESVFGKGPIELGADLYTEARVAQQKAREKLGITSLADHVENDLFPGIDVGVVGSLGSLIAGVSAMEKTGSVAKSFAVAGAIWSAVGGADVAQKADSLEREYSGEEKVPVRKGRWWLLGYQPFKGGDIDYYKPSWYTELKQDPYDVSVYGSKSNYWKYGSMLPTPSNWFGLRTVVDPYALEKFNYYDRPYPVTSKVFEEIPIIGPVLADTVGEIIKPTKVMHAKEQYAMIASSNISQRGVPTNASRLLGIPSVPVSVINLDRPDVKSDRVNKWANVALEPTGVWKFALSLFGISFGDEYQLASAGNMSSIGRSFYDKQLGGAFGETEFIRRFLLSDYSTPSKINQQINPIRNTMPSWLPGSAAESEADRQYFVDFSKGDAYTKIPGGEFRLPGRGYESVNKLHSGVSGVYSDVDKFLVLADVAPYSAAYFKYEASIKDMDLSPYWRWKVSQAKEQRDSKVTKPEFSNSSQEQIANANRSTITRGVRNTWMTVREAGLSNIPVLGAKLFPHLDPYDQYVDSVVEGESFADWKNPFETIIRPEFYTTIGESPLFAAKRGLQIGALIGSPAGGFLNPFPILSANPVATAVGGAALGAVGSIGRIAATGSWSHGFVPPHIEKERETEQYFDYLKYAKNRYLEAAAQEAGNKDLARTFKLQSQATINYGLAVFENTGDYRRYQSALGRTDRPYFDAFINAPVKDRDKILKVVPQHMQQVLSAVWNGQSMDNNTASQASLADQQALEYFESHQLPEQDWAGWSPSVPDIAIKIKSVSAGINGVSDTMHRFGAFPAQVKEANIRFNFLAPPTTDIHGQNEASIRLMANAMMSKEDGNPFSSVGMRRVHHSIGPRVDWFSAYIEDSRRNDVFAFYQDAYR